MRGSRRSALRGGEIEEKTKVDDQHELAWLVHFKRTRPNDGLPLFGSAIQEMESEADNIMRALNAKPTLLRTLRGIDICGVEEHQPLWVSADTLRRVRFSILEASLAAAPRLGWNRYA